MAIETEKKYRLDEARKAAVREALEAAGAKCRGREFELNTIYSSDDLRSRGAVLRIREKENSSLLTFKRRADPIGGAKRQIEHETEVGDADAAREILSEMGLTPVLVYEKYRETWDLRNVEVVLDELPFGHFMEIEGALTSILEAEILLDIDDLEVVPETYPRMTAEYGVRIGDVVESRFKN